MAIGPDGFALADVRTDGAAVSGLVWEQEGELLTVRFDAVDRGDQALILRFD